MLIQAQAASTPNCRTNHHEVDTPAPTSGELRQSMERHFADRPVTKSKHYHVYVVELSSDVLLNARFMRSNPSYCPGRPCVYVGMTGLDPDVRFDKHKAGIQSNRFVQEFGLRLLPKLYELYNPLTYDEARSLEVELGIDLREGGFGVWQA